MVTNFCVVLDSYFRDRTLYPRATEYSIPVNDVTAQRVVQLPLLRYTWGTSSRSRDGTVAGGNPKQIFLSDNLAVTTAGFYTGCVLSVSRGGTVLHTTLVISYDVSTNSVDLEVPTSFGAYEDGDDVSLVYPDIISQPYVVLLLTYTVHKCSDYVTLYLCNLTQGWARQIRSIDMYGKAVLVVPVPNTTSYDDVFEVRTTPSIFSHPVTSLHTNVVLQLRLTGKATQNLTGVPVYIEDANGDRMEYTFKSIPGGYAVDTLLSIAGVFTRSVAYTVYVTSNDEPCGLQAYVAEQGTVLEYDGLVTVPSPTSHVVYFDTEPRMYMSYTILSSTYILLMNGGEALPEGNDVSFGVYPTTSSPACLNIPNVVGAQQCYTIKLESIVLPNRYVKDTGHLLSVYPYVYVSLVNEQTSLSTLHTMTNHGVLKHAQFLCSIGNVKNPEVIRFVELKCPYTLSMPFSLMSTLTFQVRTPSGTILEYDDDDEMLTNTLSTTVMATFLFKVLNNEK
jgi:hypothetical protein